MTAFQQLLIGSVDRFPGATDKELSTKIVSKAVRPSRINQEARLLESRGELRRKVRADRRIGNYPARSRLLTRLLRFLWKGFGLVRPALTLRN